MSEIFTVGRWTLADGKEEAFVEAWTAFAAWASSHPGAGKLRLARDVRTPNMYVSFGRWDGIDSVRAWKGGAEFRERLAQVVQHVADFAPTELAIVATAESGAAESQLEEVAIEPAHAR
jgi:heme-degrading monooxygenase HmoA